MKMNQKKKQDERRTIEMLPKPQIEYRRGT